MVQPAKPFNQRIRIWGLRALTLFVVLPLVLFTAPALRDPYVQDVLQLVGTLLIVAAVLGRFWAILYIGAMKNKTVMQDGPYSVCRHPLYLSSTIGVLGFGLLLGSLILTLLLTGLVFAVLSATAAREEAYLRASFGPAYDAYAARVPRILPRPALFRTEMQVTVSMLPLRNTWKDALVFLGFLPLALVLDWIKAAGLVPVWLLI